MAAQLSAVFCFSITLSSALLIRRHSPADLHNMITNILFDDKIVHLLTYGIDLKVCQSGLGLKIPTPLIAY